MAKLGIPSHRYTVAILGWLYVILSTMILFYCIAFYTFYKSVLVISLIYLAIGCFGLYSLYKQNGTLMKIFGIILVVVGVLQVLEILGLLILTLVRETFLDVFLKKLMDTYYDSVDDRTTMDEIQRESECCGRQSYTDWALQPFSCCVTSDCSTFYADGCVDALSPSILYTLLGAVFLSVLSMILHIYAVVSAFELARIYRQGPILPNIKHSFANF